MCGNQVPAHAPTLRRGMRGNQVPAHPSPESGVKGMAMRVLITGGTGFIGRHLAASLLRQEVVVRLMGRSFAPVADLLAAGALPVPGDLRDAAAVDRACAGVDLVCHVGAFSAPWGRRADFLAINLAGTAHVVAACRRHAVQRLVMISSPVVIFANEDMHEADESWPYPQRFCSPYALSKKLAEDLVRNATDLPSVILRPKAVFGPGDQAMLPRLIAAARSGRLPCIGDGMNRVDLTYITNVVQAIELAMVATPAVGRTYTITNGEHVLLWEVLRDVFRRVGIRKPLRRRPLKMMLALAGLLELHASLSGREPVLTRYSVNILARTQTYTIAAAQRDLGYRPCVDVAAGIEATLAAMGAG
ncbi:MAG: NAD-dependent epimerase/dehydratase family protein [Candidatus Viridilinea halotolerans]|uniref:NAD-dependent epimerase/dehydratase family protein n=1 Tax=Candidatus Viridilinea halotolerans TaxID=2491704 RepID=A0A426TU94_9CHLR|nr:MAG: NAD-dependent epimerase/dehydratase family protein [Candidatus Viridilinea halotolerans]